MMRLPATDVRGVAEADGQVRFLIEKVTFDNIERNIQGAQLVMYRQTFVACRIGRSENVEKALGKVTAAPHRRVVRDRAGDFELQRTQAGVALPA